MTEGYQFSNQLFLEVLYKEEGSLFIIFCCLLVVFAKVSITLLILLLSLLLGTKPTNPTY